MPAFPLEYSSLNESLVYTLLEPVKAFDPVTYPDYRYIGDVYVDNVLVARIKRVPNPTTGVGVFDVGQIARNYLNCQFDPAFGEIVAQKLGDSLFNLTVTMHWGEEYGGTMFLDQLIDTDRVFFNSYSGRGYMFNRAVSRVVNKIASNRPPFGQVLLTSQFFFLSYYPIDTTLINLTVTPSGGGIPYAVSFAPDSPHQLQLINIAPANLNALQSGTITSSTTSYTVSVNGQSYRIFLICEPLYQPEMIHFLNQYGGFDSKLFNKANKGSYDITRTDFAQLPYVVDAAGNVSVYSANSVYNDGRRVYSSTFVEKAFFNTDFLSDQEYIWLRDLLLSPMIYIEDPLGHFPIVITDTNYEPKKVVIDDLTNLTINVQYAEPTLNAQFR